MNNKKGDMSRRDFLEKARKYVVTAGGSLVLSSLISLPFFGCGKEEIQEISDTASTEVNAVPFFERNYTAMQKTSDSNGNIIFDNRDFNYKISFRDKYNNPILGGGLEATLYKNHLGGETIVGVRDNNGIYLPSIAKLDAEKGKSLYSNFTSILDLIEAGDKLAIGDGGNIFLKLLNIDQWPSFTWDINKKPGRVYLGDFSFDEIKNTNTILKKSSLVLSIISGGACAGAYSVFSDTGSVLDGLDELIDGINSMSSNFQINKDTDFLSLYYEFPLFGPSILNISLDAIPIETSVDINDLSPLNPGNSWTYRTSSGNVSYEVDQNLKRFDGKDLIAVKSPGGLGEYFGFMGKTLKQFGFNHPDTGNVIFSPAINLGADSISLGSRFNTYSGIICENFPDIKGNVQENIIFNDIINKMNVQGNPYGNCWKMVEDFTMEINGETTSETASHYYAKNIGKVKIEMDGYASELIDMVINSRGVSSDKKSIISRSGLSQNPQPILTCNKYIIDYIRKKK